MNISPLQIVISTLKYLGGHPREIFYQLGHGTRLQTAIPLDLARGLLRLWIEKQNVLKDIAMTAQVPGIDVQATIAVMKNTVQVGLRLDVDEVVMNTEILELHVRLHNARAELVGQGGGALRAILSSLDFSRPADLISFLPQMPAFIKHAQNSHVVVDLTKIPTFPKQVLGWIGRWLTLQKCFFQNDHLILAWRPRLRP